MSICCCLAAQSCSALCDVMDCNTPCFLSVTISWSLLKLMSISSSVISFSSHLWSFSASESFQLSQFFTSGSQNIGVSASASNENSRFISFRIDWLGLLAVQETPKSPLQQLENRKLFGFDILSTGLTESPQLCQLLTRESACSLKIWS